MIHSICQSGGWGLENSLVLPSFSKCIQQFKEKWRPRTFAILALRLYNWVLAQGQAPTASKFSKTVEVGYSDSELKPCQREITTDEIQEKKYYRERSNIKSARVSALTGSLAQCHAKWQRRCRRIQHHAGIKPMSPDYQRPALTTQPLFRIDWLK